MGKSSSTNIGIGLNMQNEYEMDTGHFVRPEMTEIFMRMACLLIGRSNCSLLRTGCIITNTQNEILSYGYRSSAWDANYICSLGKCECICAIDKAVINCPSTKGEEKIIYTSHIPSKKTVELLEVFKNVNCIYYIYDLDNGGKEALYDYQIRNKKLSIIF